MTGHGHNNRETTKMRIKARTKPGASFAVTGVLKMIAHSESSAKSAGNRINGFQPKRLQRGNNCRTDVSRAHRKWRAINRAMALLRGDRQQIMPTGAKDPNDPIAVTSTDCQTFKPSEMSVAPRWDAQNGNIGGEPRRRADRAYRCADRRELVLDRVAQLW